jgi:hypothetical protein
VVQSRDRRAVALDLGCQKSEGFVHDLASAAAAQRPVEPLSTLAHGCRTALVIADTRLRALV